MLRVVVEGCCHGELDQIYASISRIEQNTQKKVDLLICCGDFQAVRNRTDLQCMNVPPKYLSMASFHRYYSGEKVAPVLTLFIGGNHEASNHLQELYYGGWVAPNIYYLGCSGVVNVGGVRIAGLSGIYNGRDYRRGHHETPPYSADTIRSIYHVREVEVYKLAQLREHIDVMVSHDWPRGIYYHGDMAKLLRAKPFFRQECESNTLGSVAAEFLLHQVKPSYWFSGHLHCKFAAVVRHQGNGASAPPGCTRMTKFLALDKCLPNRDFLQLVEIPRPEHRRSEPPVLEYDLEWLAILRATNDLLSQSPRDVVLPREAKLVSSADKEGVRSRLAAGAGSSPNPLCIPNNFVRTAPNHDPSQPPQPLTLMGSPQTDHLLAILQLPHRITVPYVSMEQPPPLVPASYAAGPAGAQDAPLFHIDRGNGDVSVGSGDPNAIDLDDEEETGAADPNSIDLDDDDENEAPAALPASEPSDALGRSTPEADGSSADGGDVILLKPPGAAPETSTEGSSDAPLRKKLMLPPPRMVLPPPKNIL